MGKQWFSKGFKDAVVTKIVNREGRTIAEICDEAGVGLSTGSRWLKERDRALAMKKSNNSTQWTPEAKFHAVIESSGLVEEELGLFLRKQGLHSHQLVTWRAEMLTALDPTCRKSNGVKDTRVQRIKALERDLTRKDKALAEASALLILQKKVHLIWGQQREDEK